MNRDCIHCKKRKIARSRRLCVPCFNDKDIRERYPITSKFARRGAGIDNHGEKLPASTTDESPGSDEKIKVMIERLERGESLFHPDDLF